MYLSCKMTQVITVIEIKLCDKDYNSDGATQNAATHLCPLS